MKQFAHTAAVIGCSVVLLLALAHPPANADDPHVPEQFCGNEGEGLCGESLTSLNAACDTGLLPSPEFCGCYRVLGFCVLPKLCAHRYCVNYNRRQQTIDSFAGSWIDWALRNQRNLAEDEPLNWVMHLGTHNSFNTIADGHGILTAVEPNQYYSITDQLRAGARLLTLDLYFLGFLGLQKADRLCHADTSLDGLIHHIVNPEADIICSLPGTIGIFPPPTDPWYFIGGPRPPSKRYHANGIKEMRNWLSQNPNEIVIVDFEDYTKPMGGDDEDVLAPLRTYLGDKVFRPPPIVPPTTQSGVFPERWPTRREMLDAGKQVIVIDDHYAAFSFAQQKADGTYLPSEFLFNQDSVIAGSYSDGSWLARNLRPFDHCFTDDFSPTKNLFTKVTIIVEEREFFRDHFGILSAADVASATECYSLIVLDRLSVPVNNDPTIVIKGIAQPELYPIDFFPQALALFTHPAPDFSRQKAAVWSWNEGDHGQYGDCAMMRSTQLDQSQPWMSEDCTLTARFACAKPRSESGLDPLDFEDKLGDNWQVTNAVGKWQDGPATCQMEYGERGYVFSVPVSGYQNRRLKEAARNANLSDKNIWLNYRQRNGDDKWVIGGVTKPVAKAGPDQVVECGRSASLDASGSYARNGGSLTSYKWQGPFGTVTGPTQNLATPLQLALGTNAIVLTVTDSDGTTSSDSVAITVRDTTPPSMTLSLQATYPSPRPNMVPVTAKVTVSDSCDSNPNVELVSIVSSNPIRGDIQAGADDQHFKLGATTEGKTYSLTYRATDSSGNSLDTSAQITVVKKPW